jgi:hypothetical protein
MPDWLPSGKRAAVCFSIDDIHPSKSSDAYEAGGDLERGVLGRLRRLLDRHPNLEVTLFIPADWREISGFPDRRILARIPILRDRVFLTRILPQGTMQLDRHPRFVEFLRAMPRTHVGLHGRFHVHKGLRPLIEFQDESVEHCRQTLEAAVAVFRQAGIDFVPGMCPPAWNAPPNLLEAMVQLGMTFVASARDVWTPVAPDAATNMSGMKGVSLIYPQWIQNGRMVHISSNFAANNPIDRAVQIIEAGGLVGIKAHAIKHAGSYMAVDGLDAHYCNYLDILLSVLEDRYGDSIWWTSMHRIADRMLQRAPLRKAS